MKLFDLWERGMLKAAGVAEFYVDGKSIPDVGWDVGPSWSGLLPISNKTDETRKVGDIGIVTNYLTIDETSSAILLVLPSGSTRECRRPDLLVSHAGPQSFVETSTEGLRRTNGGPGCSSLEGFLQENGVREHE